MNALSKNITTKNNVIGAFLGTVVEYYDYGLFAFSASIIAAKFFVASDHTTALINVFGIYALGYFAKPLGALIFSKIGDKYGRKVALNITIFGIAVPTVIIGLLPTYESIGIWSAVALSICRFAQNLFIGGEYDGAAIYVIEHLGQKYRYTASAITRSMCGFGLLIGVSATNFFNSTLFIKYDFAWRIPFLLALPLAIITAYYRKQLIETPDFGIVQQHNLDFQSISQVLKRQWKVVAMVALFAGGFGVTYQISVMFMKQYLPMVLPESKLIISTFSTILVACFGVAMIVSGVLADYFGNVRVIKFSLIFVILSIILLVIAISYQILNLSLMAALMVAIFVAPFNGLAHGIVIKMFPINERYRCISIGHTIGSMLMSGSAGYVCLTCMKTYNLPLFPLFYILIFAFVSYIMVHIFAQRLSN